jgi:Glycosyltransferase family 87
VAVTGNEGCDGCNWHRVVTALATPALRRPDFAAVRRLVVPGLAIVWTLLWWGYATANGHHRDMTWWAADYSNLYAGGLATDGFYGYSPAFVQILEPLRMLPWSMAAWVWGGVMLGALVLSAGRWTPLAIILPPVLGELIIGNVHLLYAAAIVLGFRWPQAWALMLLTKVTPGVGVLWFAVRREWRNMALALGATAAIALVSFAIAPDLWGEWVAELSQSAGRPPLPIQPNALFPIPLLVRLPVAVAIVVWAARGDRKWAVPLAVVICSPVIWTAGLSTLVAMIALRPRRGARAAPDPRSRIAQPAES